MPPVHVYSTGGSSAEIAMPQALPYPFSFIHTICKINTSALYKNEEEEESLGRGLVMKTSFCQLYFSISQFPDIYSQWRSQGEHRGHLPSLFFMKDKS